MFIAPWFIEAYKDLSLFKDDFCGRRWYQFNVPIGLYTYIGRMEKWFGESVFQVVLELFQCAIGTWNWDWTGIFTYWKCQTELLLWMLAYSLFRMGISKRKNLIVSVIQFFLFWLWILHKNSALVLWSCYHETLHWKNSLLKYLTSHQPKVVKIL